MFELNGSFSNSRNFQENFNPLKNIHFTKIRFNFIVHPKSTEPLAFIVCISWHFQFDLFCRASRQVISTYDVEQIAGIFPT